MEDKREDLELLLEKYFLEVNSPENRTNFANDVSEIMGFRFVDKTDEVSLYKGNVILEGYNQKTGKTITITIENSNFTFLNK